MLEPATRRPSRVGVSVETRQAADGRERFYARRDGERLLFRNLVGDHYLPSLRDASPNTRKNTASHLGDGSGVPTRFGRHGDLLALDLPHLPWAYYYGTDCTPDSMPVTT